MKILFVVTDTEIGGVTTAAYNFIFELSQKGNEVTFLDFSACKQNENLPAEVKQIFLHGRSKYWKLGKADVDKAPFFKKMLLLLLGILKKLTNKSSLWNKLIFRKLKGDYDVAIAFRQCAPCYSFVLNKVNAKKKIGFIHGELSTIGDITSGWGKHMYFFDKIAYVSETVKKEFINTYPQLSANACTVHNCLNVQLIREKAKQECSINIDDKKLNIVTVSRVDNFFKCVDRIPRICCFLKSRTNVSFHWYVVGGGVDLETDVLLAKELEVEDVLTFVGEKENPYSILKKADISVLTSKTESFGLVVPESLLLGVPVVVGEYPTVHEILKDCNCGIIAEQNEISIAQALLTLLENNEHLETLKKNCQSFEYSNEDIINQFFKEIR